MRRAVCLSILLASSLALPLPAAGKDDPARFDGTWDTVLSCTNYSDAQGYSNKFPAVVKAGSLHAEMGTKGKPGWLTINGIINPDGTARLYADGLVGASQFAVGGRPAGTEYGYHIDARFKGDQGSGKRVEGRPCDVTFARVK